MPVVIVFLALVIVLIAAGDQIFSFIGNLFGAVYDALLAVVFNFLTLIYAVIPGHDFGVALIIFTAAIRLIMWPLIKKQLHQAKVMRKVQPELKKIREKAKGDKQLEGRLMLEFYREKGISPFGSIGILVAQLPIILILFQVVRLISEDANNVLKYSFEWVQNVGYMQEVKSDINNFSEKLFGTIDLTVSALGNGGKIYIPVLIMAVLAAIFQYYQSKQLLPQPKEKKTLKQIFKDASQGKQADQSEMTAAMSGTMIKIFPLLTFVFAISVQGALTLYLLVTTLVGWAQQSYILSKDTEELEEIAEKSSKKSSKVKQSTREKNAKEAKIVKESKPNTKKPNKKKKQKKE